MLLADLPSNLPGALAREMTLVDVPAVHTLELQLFPADAWPLDMFLAEITHPTRGYLVLVDQADAEIIGYAGVMAVGDTADVQTIAVTPEREGQGYGSALLDFLAAEATARGAEQILLEVRADNPRAQDLYTRKGYEQIHTRRGYYNDGVDALIMRRALTGSTDESEAHHD